MPDAINLKLGFLNKRGKISRGTWLTTLEFLGGNGKIRRDGKVIDSKIGEFTFNLSTPEISFHGLSIPWGDVYSSFRSTGIPNAEVYLGIPKILVMFRSIFLLLLRLFKIELIKKIAVGYIRKNFNGPTKQERDSTKTFILGKVENKNGEVLEEVYQFMEGYNLTALGAAECVVRVLQNSVEPGYKTPSIAFGSNFMDLFVIKRLK
jgi:short subunit dehydrogenase-like uncharacterized protein